jgi:hypothetical protein
LIAAQASHAQGQLLCIDFTNFCDGLEIVINEDNTISGNWVNNDCAGASNPVQGGVVSQNKYRVVCAPNASCPAGISWMFIFTIEPRPSTFDMVGSTTPGDFFPQQIDQPWSVSQGSCAFANDGSGTPSAMFR